MKFSTQEEYGLRCLLRIAKEGSGEGLTIPEISKLEGLTQANVAKFLRILRMRGFIDSSRGASGGYKLNMAPEDIVIGQVLEALGGKLFETSFCSDYSGQTIICTNSIDCSIRSLWNMVQESVDNVLQKTTLKDLMGQKSALEMLLS
jgi:Rrf2 family protein